MVIESIDTSKPFGHDHAIRSAILATARRNTARQGIAGTILAVVARRGRAGRSR